MKHPNREEWVPFVFGEAPPQARQELGRHLASCPECRVEIEAWQRSLHKLDHWELSPPISRPPAINPVVKWAIAAAVMISVGFGLGRWTASSVADPLELKADIQSTVDQALAGRIDQALAKAQSISAGTLAEVEDRLAKASELQSHHMLKAVADIIRTGREDDSRALRGVLQELQAQHSADLLSLRRDLETVASTTEEKIRQTHWNLTQLTSSP